MLKIFLIQPYENQIHNNGINDKIYFHVYLKITTKLLKEVRK